VKFLSVLLGALVSAGTANAIPPGLTSLSHQDRHPRATLFAPRAGDATIYLATKPDRSTDGSFLSENVETLDSLTDSEIQTGSWLHERQLDPGTYYVMLRASPDFDACYVSGTGTYDPACADGYSQVVTLVIPKPASRYSVAVRKYGGLREFTLTLRARPLGENRPYRLCYRLRSKRRVCLRSTLNGFGWNSAAEDSLDVSMRNLARLTTFIWFVGPRKVASRTVRR
jgi:hypothetical protein